VQKAERSEMVDYQNVFKEHLGGENNKYKDSKKGHVYGARQTPVRAFCFFQL
jgi:hypothetical protein